MLSCWNKEGLQQDCDVAKLNAFLKKNMVFSFIMKVVLKFWGSFLWGRSVIHHTSFQGFFPPTKYFSLGFRRASSDKQWQSVDSDNCAVHAGRIFNCHKKVLTSFSPVSVSGWACLSCLSWSNVSWMLEEILCKAVFLAAAPILWIHANIPILFPSPAEI